MSEQTFRNIKLPKIITWYTLCLLVISGISIGIKFYFFPIDVPLNLDALYYFWYSSDIFHAGEFPKNWAPNNMGWSTFVSIFFTLVDSKDVFVLMQVQKFLSVIISVLTIFPTYFLCKKFVSKKIALVGASFIAFDPRLMINSFLGVTDPLYILLITSSLAFFLSSNKKLIYFSFILIGFATIVRAEALEFFLVISVMFIVRYRKDRYKVFLKYIFAFGLFMLIVVPVTLYQNEVLGSERIFIKSIQSGNSLSSSFTSNGESSNRILEGLELFSKYLIWVLIPNFIIFIPLGLFLILQKKDFKNYTIILLTIITAIPAFWAYMNNIQETRYLYVLFPMFSVIAVLSIEKIVKKTSRENLMVLIIISMVLIFSMVFYEQLKIDYIHERESFEIMEKIYPIVNGVNDLNHESSYLKTVETMEKWPNEFGNMGLGNFEIIILSTSNFNSLNNYIIESKTKGLTHIIIDDDSERQNFLINVFDNENGYPYLQKIYDSKTEGFTYHVKVFKIDYELFDSIVNKRE